MPFPANFTAAEWDAIAERRRDHLRQHAAVVRNVTGLRNEVTRLNARLTALSGEQKGTAAVDETSMREQANLSQDYAIARLNLQHAESELEALASVARQIELDLIGEVGSTGLLLPDFR